MDFRPGWVGVRDRVPPSGGPSERPLEGGTQTRTVDEEAWGERTGTVAHMKARIAGGGIGGLTAALCLHEIGMDVRVFESVETIRPLGVGINLLPHCVRVLNRLGLAPRLA